MLELKDNNPMYGHPWAVKVKLELPFHLIFKPLPNFNFNTTIEKSQELRATCLWTFNNRCKSNRFTTLNTCHLFNRNNAHMYKPNDKLLQVIKPLKLGYQI